MTLSVQSLAKIFVRSIIVIGLLIFIVSLWAMFTPIKFDSREEVFEIPKGTWARRMAGEKIEILPSAVYLTLGIHDILVLRNSDTVPQIFGPTLIMPGQSFKLPFDLATEYQFACTAHLSGQMTVVVDSEPNNAWQRLVWRSHQLKRKLK